MLLNNWMRPCTQCFIKFMYVIMALWKEDQNINDFQLLLLQVRRESTRFGILSILLKELGSDFGTQRFLNFPEEFVYILHVCFSLLSSLLRFEEQILYYFVKIIIKIRKEIVFTYVIQITKGILTNRKGCLVEAELFLTTV